MSLCANLKNLEIYTTVTVKYRRSFCKVTSDHEFDGVVYESAYICKPKYERIDRLEATRFSIVFGGSLITKITAEIKTVLSSRINRMFDCEDYRLTRYHLAG